MYIPTFSLYSLHFHSILGISRSLNNLFTRAAKSAKKKWSDKGKTIGYLCCFRMNNMKKSIGTQFFFVFLVCQMATHGLTTLIGPLSSSAANHVQCLTSQLQVPHIETRFDYTNILSPFSFNIHPHPAKLGKVS